MTTDPPIACTLTSTELPERLAEIRAIGRSSLVGAETGAARAVLRFSANEEMRKRLAHVVAAEAECCSFLTLDLADVSGTSVLTIEAPVGGEEVMRELVAAFRGGGGA